MDPHRRAVLLLSAVGIVSLAGGIWIRWRHRPVRSVAHRAPSSAPAILGLVGLAGVIAFSHEHGWYLGDNRFIQYWAPSRSLRSISSVWNPQVDVGGPTQHFFPIPDVLLSALRAVGFSPWVTQRAWFWLVLALGSVGTAVVVRAVLPGARAAAVIAGAWFLCAPFTVGFLFPTALFLNVALAPWFLLAVWHGTTSSSRWRWAAVFALGVATSGSMNPPGLLYALLPAGIVGVALLVGGRATLRGAVTWGVRAAVLSVIVLAPVALRGALASDTLSRNLQSTESVDAVSTSSSWSESVRGLGFWLQYWNPRGPLVLPYLTAYFTNPWVLCVTFVPPVLAGIAIFAARPRARLAFGAVFALVAALMVGAFPLGRPSPLGRFLRWSYDALPGLFAFRNTYKAGAGLLLAVGTLLAIGWHEVIVPATASPSPNDDRRRRSRAVACLGLAAVVFVTTGWPLLSGAAFQHGQRLHGDVPAYWREATDWLDEQPGAGRVLVVPGTQSEDYRWGSAAGGDMFASILERPAILAQPLTGSPAEAANLTVALDRIITSGRYEPGTLVPIARRLGVQYLVIRNDLRWETTGVARPSLLRSVREDSDLEPAATFGARGENVTRDDDKSPEVEYEDQLPPVEILTIPGVDDVARAVSPAPALLLAGDGAGWSALARSGALDDLGPVRATAPLPRDDLLDELQQGASVVITDTNRRTPLAWGQEDRTLTAEADVLVSDLYGVEGSQTVVTFGEGGEVSDVGPATIFDVGRAHRAAAAFDGDVTTAWLTGLNDRPRGQRLRIDLASPSEVDEVRVRVANAGNGRVVTKVAVRLDDHDPEVFDVLPGMENVLRVPATMTERVEVAPVGVAGGGAGPFGFSELRLPGLDLAERVTMPSDVALAARGDDRVASRLARSPLSVAMQRLVGNPRDVEATLARRFDYPVRRPVELAGSLQVTPSSSPMAVGDLLGLPVRLDDQRRVATSVPAAPWLAAVDGDERTMFVPDGSVTTVHTDGAEIRTLRLVLGRGGDDELPSYLSLTRSADNVVLDPERRCERPGRLVRGGASITIEVSPRRCSIDLSWPAGDPSADEVTLSSRTEGEEGERPLPLHEVEVNGRVNTMAFESGACRDDLLLLDGVSVPARLRGSIADLLEGRPIGIESCDVLELTAGWHELLGAPGLPITWARLDASDGDKPVSARTIEVVVDARSADSLALEVDAPAGTRVISGQAHSTGWRADGLGTARSFDTQSAWVLAEDGQQRIHISHRAHRAMSLSVGLSLAVLACLPGVIVADPRRRLDDDRVVPPSSRAWRGLPQAARIATALFGYVVGGLPLLVVAVAAILTQRRGWITPKLLGFGGVGLLLFATVWSLPPIGPSLEPVWPLWAGTRDVANELARVAVVVMVAAMSGLVDVAPTTDASRSDGGG